MTGVGLPSWPIDDARIRLVLSFLALDLLYYLVHRLEHAVPLLWRFHALHHSDPDVDVTTSVRHHPLETLITSAIYWFAVLLLGIPAVVVGTHALTVFCTVALQHGNIRLPEWLEHILQPVVITGEPHLVHHSVAYDDANANFAAVLSSWDRIFGTYRRFPRARQERIVFGVCELPPRGCLSFFRMLLTLWLISRHLALEVTNS